MKKDKQWLKDSFFKLEKNPSWGNSDYHLGSSDAFEMFEGLIDQLEEPEITEEQATLSKKETVEIPQFVADWLKKRKGYFETPYEAMLYINHCGWDDDTHIEYKLFKWIPDNAETFFKAWKGDYAIEPEPPRWVVRFKVQELDEPHWFSRFYRKDPNPLRPNGYSSPKAKEVIKFTDKSKADAVALLIDGTVELIEGWKDNE